MKHIVLIIGLLVLPMHAAAQCPQTDRARELLEKEPIGHYTKAVLERADEGILNAKNAPGGVNISHAFGLDFLLSVQSAVYLLLDTDLRSVEYSRNLSEINTCLHIDLAMIEAKIEEVRCELNVAYANKSPEGIRKLKSVSAFLNQRYKHLVKGALNPSVVDVSWPLYHDFDPPFQGWCCVLDQLQCQIRTSDECSDPSAGGVGGYNFFTTRDTCLNNDICVFADDGETDPPYTEMCPFDSNYLAFNSSGYGCNTELIAQFADDTDPLGAEPEALNNLAEKRDEFLEDIDHIRDTTRTMDKLVDETILSEDERTRLENFGDTATTEIEYRRVYGCNADLPPEEREDDERVEGLLTPGIKPSQEWSAIPMRGAFSFGKNQLGIWNAYFRLQRTFADQREYPDFLRYPNEFVDEEDRKDAMRRDGQAFGLLEIPRSYLRKLWREFMLNQATEESSILPKAQDLSLTVRDTMKPVRPSMKRNIELVQSGDEGLRKFAKGYAYFLLRTCIHRPCTEKLETITKTLFSDECFPYASGEFQLSKEGDEEEDTRTSWQRCLDAIQDL